MNKRLGRATSKIDNVKIASYGAIVGKKEGEGPIGNCFDVVMPDNEWGEKTWEKTESKMQREALRIAAQKLNFNLDSVDRVFSGDLLNQCIGAGFGLRDLQIPFYGIYGACSTMIEGISLGALLTDGGFINSSAAVTSSHFCTAERQYRTPLEYGGQRTPTAQWTVTGSGAVILLNGTEKGDICVKYVTAGKIVDKGVKDANNMGGAMAPAAADTIVTHFRETKKCPKDYDLIITGDLGCIGKEIVTEMTMADGFDISENYCDCGELIYNIKEQDVHAGGSGCGCIGSVLCGYIFDEMKKGKYKKVLAVGTGALLSPTSSLQGESVPGIAHAVSFEIE